MNFYISIGEIQDHIEEYHRVTGEAPDFPFILHQIYTQKHYLKEFPGTIDTSSLIRLEDDDFLKEIRKLYFYFSDKILHIPERFDIVIFKYPDDESRLFIKRVIGLPGEVVEIKDGKVYIDGSPTPLDDSFIPEKMIGSYGPYTVPENCYFMLGDNRNDSKDSRSWKNKFVRFDQIVGKAVVRYYPSFKWLG